MGSIKIIILSKDKQWNWRELSTKNRRRVTTVKFNKIYAHSEK